MNVLRTIIVPAGMVTAARQLGTEIAPGGRGMYVTGLSPTGLPPATHYVSSGWIEEQFAAILNDGLMIHNAAVAGAAAQGIPKVATQQQALDIQPAAVVHSGKTTKLIEGQSVEVDESPHDLFARLDLKIVQESI